MEKTGIVLLAVLLAILPLAACGRNPNGTEVPPTASDGKEKARIIGLTVDGVKQNLENTQIPYKLTGNEVRIPVVEAELSEGEGTLNITQATSIPGTATVALDNEVKYTIMLETDFIYETSALQNTYHRLVSEQKLNVAYIGGSVTVGAFGSAGHSWASLTTAWLREHFADAEIAESNAGIGGTGCLLGAYRAYRHLGLGSATKRPDLVFMDFSVNDMYDGTSAEDIKRYAETMLQTVYTANPYADVVILIVGEQTTSNRPEPKAWREIAALYNLPIVELTDRLLADMRQEGKNWSYYIADVVHPNDNGYAKYASYIAELLQAELIDKQVSPFLQTEKALPETTLSGTTLHDLSMYEAYQMPVPADSGFQSVGPDLIDGGLAAKTAGATLNFTFSGTGLTLFLGNRDSVVIEYTIDGVQYADLNVPDGILPSLADGLEDGTHTVSLRVKSASSGTFMIRRFLVRGNTAQKAVKIRTR